jgi:hypothetical protein
MFDWEAFEKVAAAARALRRTDDPTLQASLAHLRDLWITVANEGDFTAAARLVKEVLSIERLQAKLINIDAFREFPDSRSFGKTFEGANVIGRRSVKTERPSRGARNRLGAQHIGTGGRNYSQQRRPESAGLAATTLRRRG